MLLVIGTTAKISHSISWSTKDKSVVQMCQIKFLSHILSKSANSFNIVLHDRKQTRLGFGLLVVLNNQFKDVTLAFENRIYFFWPFIDLTIRRLNE